MIAPVAPYAARGVIWYQGEGNRARAWQYRAALPLLIRDWRERWGRGDWPFYFCQLAAFGAPAARPGESDWAELREAQALATRVPNTALAVTLDLGEAEDIHPRRKAEVGERLARIALARDYGRAVVYRGPVWRALRVEGDKVRLAFDHCDGGLVARPLPVSYALSTLKGTSAPLTRRSPRGQLEGFAICGADRHWVWADAEIDGDTVIVSAPGVARPVAVRYAWSDFPVGNLYNGAGLPAGTFRTDDFPLLSRDGAY
ncbi:MAG: sialate O-acetylesterase [Verrucomicrobiales bacterium]|nr:sialate O-acetylesterase [Verrucomicrobiales bacterium]